MSMMEGFMAKFDELRGEIHSLRTRVTLLEATVTSLRVEAAASVRATAQPPAPTITAKSTTGAPTTAKSASK